MRSKLLAFLREQAMVQPGDKVVCAVSGGADSMAMLWAMWLMKDQLKITVEAAHFNHNLRGEESNRDEAFVVAFCKNHNIPCHVGAGKVEPGEKGLEAAARNARYAYLQSLPGKIATAHTADDNGETYRAAVVVPILAAGDAIGAVILVSRDADAKMSTTELKVCETAANFMGKQMEN